ncbi:hypothetical protein MCSV2_30270 [Mucispirillum schaedleri ASF457]|nr:hypothetical protein MCSV2_30270 [Mucispirillum schaedleri ASF457]
MNIVEIFGQIYKIWTKWFEPCIIQNSNHIILKSIQKSGLSHK